MLLIKPNLKFWLVLSIIFDGGSCAADRHAKPISRRSSYDSSSSNDPHPNLDQVYTAKSFRKHPEPASSTTIHSSDWSVLNVVNGYFKSAHATWNRFTGFSSQSSSPSQRAYRNADDKVMFVNHTSIVAHMVNGIYLQSGLMEGTIPIDELVAELLNFGSVKVEDVVNFKADGITGLVSQLKTTRSELEGAGPGVIEIEQDVVKWNKMRSDYELIGDFKKLPREKAQFEEVTNLDLSLLKDLDQIGDALTAFVKRLGYIEEAASANLAKTSKQDDVKNNVKNLGADAEDVVDGKAAFNVAANKLISDKTLLKGAETFKPLETVVYLANSRQSSTRTPFIGIKDDMINTISSNVDKVLKLVTSFTSAGSEIKSIDALAGRRSRSEAVKYIDAFTNHLSSLNQLSQDVRDPWLGKVLAMEGSKVNNLVEGFQPLFKAVDQMGRIGAKLQPISSDAVHQSLLKFSPLRDVVSSLAFDSTKTKDVIEKYQACSEKHQLSFNETESFIKNVKLLEDLNNKIQDLMGTDVSELKKEIDAYIKTLPPVDDIQALADHINKNNADLNRLKQRIEEFKEPFDDINIGNITTLVIPAMKKTIEGSFFNYISKALDTEEEVQKCLRPLTDGEKFAGALEVIQMLREMENDQFESFNIAVSTISQVSEDLASIISIPKTMKNEAKNVAIAINKFVDADKQSRTLGQTARSLQYAYALKNRESSVTQLKTDKSFIRDEIRNIHSLKERNIVEALWGDHKKDIDELEAALAKIKDFDSKLDVSSFKTMADYGTALQDLAEVTDSKINVQNKLDALDALIAMTNGTIEQRLKEAKASLVTLSDLDLEFSTHRIQFQNSRFVFKDFEEFLLKFLLSDHNEKLNISQPASDTSSVQIWTYIAIAAVIFIFLIVVLVVVNFVQKKMINDKKMAFLLCVQNLELTFEKEEAEKMIGSIKDEQVQNTNKILKRSPYRGESIQCMDKSVFFASSVADPNEFWELVLDENCDVVIMIGNVYGGSSMFHRYFQRCSKELLKLREVEISTVSVNHDKKKERFEFILKVEKGVAFPSEKVTVLTIPCNDGLPNIEASYEIIKKAKKLSKNHFLIHSISGIDEAMTVIGFHFCSELAKKSRSTFESVLNALTVAANGKPIKKPILIHWLILGIMYFLCQGNRSYMQIYNEHMERFNEKQRAKGGGDSIGHEVINEEEKVGGEDN